MSIRIAIFSLALSSALAACEDTTVHPDESSPWIDLDWVIVAKLSHGEMSTTLPSGETFTGTYLNITPNTRPAKVEPYHRAWGEGFAIPANGDVAAWKVEQEEHVVALLSGDASTKMRCVLTLEMLDIGMEGGGEGTCELSSGELLRARFSIR